MAYPEKTLLKGSGPEVYVVLGGQRRWCTTPSELDPYGGWPAVKNVPDADLQALPIGPPVGVVPNGLLLNGRGEDPVYFMDGGQRRWVPDIPTLDTLGGWSKVTVVGKDLVNSLPLGAPYPQAAVSHGTLYTSNTWHQSAMSMSGDAYLTAQGQLGADITTACGWWFKGFTGGCLVVVIDANDNRIYQWLTWPLGVDGTKALTPSRRTDHPVTQIDPSLASQAVRIEMWFSHMGKNRWDTILADIRKGVNDLRDLYNSLSSSAPT